MSKAFELVVFDWDGTLMDSEAHIVSCMQRAAADLDMPALSRDKVRNIIGLGMREAVATLFPQHDDDAYQAIIDRYRVHFFTDDLSAPFDGVEDVLQSLRDQGYLLAVATGKSRRGLDRVLKHIGYEQYFIETRCADETCSKPHPQMLQEIMEVLDIRPEQTLMIGDTEYDLKMAHAAGAVPLGVDYGVHERERLIDCKPVGCLSSIQELPDWLTQYVPGSVMLEAAASR
jgi:phosphoglycolate phosphatase